MNERLTPSTELLPDRSDRDAAVKSLEAKCRRIVNLAHDVAEAEHNLSRLESEVKAAAAGGSAKPELFDEFRTAAVRFGTLEADLYNLKDEIEAELKVANRDRHFGIYVSHTQEGLPIRVSTTRKVPLWG